WDDAPCDEGPGADGEGQRSRGLGPLFQSVHPRAVVRALARTERARTASTDGKGSTSSGANRDFGFPRGSPVSGCDGQSVGPEVILPDSPDTLVHRAQSRCDHAERVAKA